MPSPDGYRKALRLMKQAETFNRPVVCFVDTPGAFCGLEAEERGQGEAIARNLFEMASLTVPVLSMVIGEGGSGGALAMAVANEVWMLENAIYSILSPEGFASILYKDSKKAPDLVVVEGPLAGGHLGFSLDQLTQYGADTDDVPSSYDQAAYDQEIKAILKVVKEYGDKYGRHIPVVVAGGIYTHEDVMHQIGLGADGVQVATRFVTTQECDAPEVYKQAYIAAGKADIVITKSPVGMPGRAIKNSFLTAVGDGIRPAIPHCYRCLEKCDIAKIPYCITQALVNAARGDNDNALLFCGSNACRATEISTVERVMDSLMGNTAE